MFSWLAERSFRLRSAACTFSSAAVAGFTLHLSFTLDLLLLHSRNQISCFGTTKHCQKHFYCWFWPWSCFSKLKQMSTSKKGFWIHNISVSMPLVLHGVLLINVKRKGASKREWSFPQRVGILNGTEVVWTVKSEAVFAIENRLIGFMDVSTAVAEFCRGLC